MNLGQKVVDELDLFTAPLTLGVGHQTSYLIFLSLGFPIYKMGVDV